MLKNVCYVCYVSPPQELIFPRLTHPWWNQTCILQHFPRPTHPRSDNQTCIPQHFPRPTHPRWNQAYHNQKNSNNRLFYGTQGPVTTFVDNMLKSNQPVFTK